MEKNHSSFLFDFVTFGLKSDKAEILETAKKSSKIFEF